MGPRFLSTTPSVEEEAKFVDCVQVKNIVQ